MSYTYTVTLYANTSNPNVITKSITKLADVLCDFKKPVDVENPEIYISATDAYDTCNYIYISEFGRYYFAKAVVGTGQTITYQCVSDPLMSFASAIKSSPAVVSRNPWHFNLYLPDPKLPIEARTASAIINFPNNPFNGKNNCYILTTVGSGST